MTPKQFYEIVEEMVEGQYGWCTCCATEAPEDFLKALKEKLVQWARAEAVKTTRNVVHTCERTVRDQPCEQCFNEVTQDDNNKGDK